MTTIEMIPVFKDLVLAFAAIITVCIAINGLNTWKRELRGKAVFSKSHELIHSAYKLRDEIAKARNPWISLHEIGDAVPIKTDLEQAEEMQKVYAKRWSYVLSALSEYEAQMLQAEALWGPKIKEVTSSLKRCATDLYVAMGEDVGNLASGGQSFKADPEYADEVRTTVRDIKHKNNKFTSRIEDSIQELEARLRNNLQWSTRV